MAFEIGCETDKGTVRVENQDSFIVKCNSNVNGDFCMVALCDGMGGLSEGSVASNTVANAFERWYIERVENGFSISRMSSEEIIGEINVIISYCHDKLVEYGQKKNIRLGTTLALLLINNNSYIAINIGDSRIYVCNTQIKKVTVDDTVAARMAEENKFTADDARFSDKRHILTQCIGTGKNPQPHIICGNCGEGDVIFLCTDGMYNSFIEKEISDFILKQRNQQGESIMNSVKNMISDAISRGEDDNITGIVVAIV